MKNKIFIIALLCVSAGSFAQVIIGPGKTAPTNSSVSLEFGTEEKGIVLPWVTTAAGVESAAQAQNPAQTVADGTLIMDASDKKVKLMRNGAWFDMTLERNGVVDTALQNSLSDRTEAKSSIGNPTSTPGILVLEDTNKGMILPQVASYLDITSPAAGMVVFDTSKKLLCFFNGTQWTFWKPQ